MPSEFITGDCLNINGIEDIWKSFNNHFLDQYCTSVDISKISVRRVVDNTLFLTPTNSEEQIEINKITTKKPAAGADVIVVHIL